MPSRARKIVQAWQETPHSGFIELSRDWRGKNLPPVALCRGESCSVLATLALVPDTKFGLESSYLVNAERQLVFVLRLANFPTLDPVQDVVYVAGDFNGWQNAIGQEEWALVPGMIEGEPVLMWSGSLEKFTEPQQFKFVTNRNQWLPVPAASTSAVRDENGNANHRFDPERTGHHLFAFELPEALDLTEAWTIGWADTEKSDEVTLRPGNFFFGLKTDWPLGAIVNGSETTFRLFAPRASHVTLGAVAHMEEMDQPLRYELKRLLEADGNWRGAWEITLEENMHGWFYWYHVDGPNSEFGMFDATRRIPDPYAWAMVQREGPSIVIDRATVKRADRSFATPGWQDLVIAEAHVRDLAANAPVRATAPERLGFTGLKKWVESPEFYLERLGVNAVELQPVQEFDNVTTAEYHWGYMTNNFFAPESSYGLAPLQASYITELQELVAAFHRRGLAVILDVVYNHVGEPAHLMFIDKLYYFETDNAGQLANWSGCGNDLRCTSAMSKRLIIDSLRHLVETFGVDGFRFDLAELIGPPVLREIERELKKVKSDIVLIAEPWSFRGHIAGELRDTGFASWNDGYRNFIKEYVRGGSSRGQFEYFLKGSPWHFAKWPAQTVNYAESHDDRTWTDVITENPDFNGQSPTAADRRRTHLMAAILFASIGVPMLAAGQDFMRSKQGVNNTYQRGDLNALDYRRLYRFPGTHAYFVDWIAFRRSETGRLFRHYSRASEGFFQFFFPSESSAAAALYNADGSQGGTRLLFAVNPTTNDVVIPLADNVIMFTWKQLADVERFYGETGRGGEQRVDADLFVPALGCGLWISLS